MKNSLNLISSTVPFWGHAMGMGAYTERGGKEGHYLTVLFSLCGGGYEGPIHQ